MTQQDLSIRNELSKEVSDFIAHINKNPLTSNYIFDEDDHNIDELLDKLEALITLHIREAQIDMLSDAIIECYDHDNPMDIAKELEKIRRVLQREDK